MSTRTARGTRHLVTTSAATLALVLTGCSGGEESPAGEPEPSQSLLEPSDAPTLEVEPVTTSGTLVGRLPRKDRTRTEQAVSRATVRWLEAAYLGGKYPRRDFRDAFPGFTGGARAEARRDLGLMTNKRLAARVDTVTPTAIRVRVDLLAVKQRPVTATAHFRVSFRAEGKVRRAMRVAGRLMMTRAKPGWRVFAYDVTRAHQGGRANGEPDRAKQKTRGQQKTRQKTEKRTEGGRG